MKHLFIPLFIVAIAAIVIMSIRSGNGTLPLNVNLIPQPTSSQTTLLFTGDVMLGRSVMKQALGQSHPVYPFVKVAEKLQSADLTVINLENPIIEKCPFDEKMTTVFCSDPRMVVGLTHAGVDVANLANNHTLDHGQEGLDQTKRYLDLNNIAYTGLGEVTIKRINGVKFGFLGFEKSQQQNPKLTSQESDLIKRSDALVDVLIVSIHWGVEYESKASAGQRALAKEIVKLGADMIVGHHPHWVQDMEKVDGKPVYYSLGNFVFDQMWSEETKKGVAMKVTFEGKNMKTEETLPIYIKSVGQPEWQEK